MLLNNIVEWKPLLHSRFIGFIDEYMVTHTRKHTRNILSIPRHVNLLSRPSTDVPTGTDGRTLALPHGGRTCHGIALTATSPRDVVPGVQAPGPSARSTACRELRKNNRRAKKSMKTAHIARERRSSWPPKSSFT